MDRIDTIEEVEALVERLQDDATSAHRARFGPARSMDEMRAEFTASLAGVESARRLVQSAPGGVDLWARYRNASTLETRRERTSEHRGKQRGRRELLVNPFTGAAYLARSTQRRGGDLGLPG